MGFCKKYFAPFGNRLHQAKTLSFGDEIANILAEIDRNRRVKGREGEDMFIGLDLGTSGLRGLLTDDQGHVLADAEETYPVLRSHPGWSEQNPADWISALGRVLDALSRAAPSAIDAVEALAFSGQMHGATLLDAAGHTLRPSILWNDTRSAEEAAKLDDMPPFRALSGNIVFPGFTAPKLLWVARHEPQIFDRVAKVLLPKDFVVHYLTGRAASEMSDAAGTAWLDTGARVWSEDLLSASGMRPDQMPDLFEGTAVVGEVLPHRAEALGLPKGVRVIAGAGDNAAAACGIGVLTEGDGFVSLGTSGVLLAARDGFHPEAATAVHSFCHAVPDTWYQVGVILAATDSLNWLGQILGQDARTLTAQLGDRVQPPGPVRFVPYLSGERTPHNDSTVRGAFLNLDIASTPQDLTRAVLEGVSFALRDSLEALRQAGADPKSLTAIGGGTGSRYWTSLMASVLGLPLDLPAKGEFGAAMGAARLAQCGATGAASAEIMTKPEIAETIDPDPALGEACAAAFAAYQASYAAIKSAP